MPLRALAALGLALLLAFALSSCSRAGEPSRPAQVPAEAFWLGGPDGGAFVALSRATTDPPTAVRARIFYPHGELWFAGRLQGRPGDAPVDVTRRELFSGWDGEALHLSDGRSLRRVR